MPVDASVSHDQWARFIYCRDNGHLKFVSKADKCDKFFAGDQWIQEDLNALELAGRPAITINKIISTLSTILGEQIQNRVEVLFRPNNGAPAEVADALSKVWMQISQNNQLPWVRSDIFCDGMIRSRGFYDVRLDFTDSMEGEVRILQLNSKNVVIDPDAEEYDPDKWADVFTSKWMTPQDIEILYNKDDADYLKIKGRSDYLFGYDSIERTRDRFSEMPLDVSSYQSYQDNEGVRRSVRVLERQYRKLDKQEHFVDIETGDMRAIPNDWDRNRIALLIEKTGGKLSTTKKMVKRIRWTTTADNVVLHDEWSPYNHFTVVPFFPFFRYGRTIGVVENLLGPQEILNKVSSQELHVVNTTANSGWILEENSLTNMSIEELEVSGSKTGLVVEYRKGTQPPNKIQPNQVPTGLDRVSMKSEDHIKSISGVSDSMQGFDREDVAAKAIAYKQQRGAVNLTKPLDNLERTDWILARNVLDIVQNYYTEPRLISITHEDVTKEAEQVTVNERDDVTGQIKNDLTLGEYNIVITSAPARSSLEDSQFEQARAMLELGIPIPHDVLIENSRLQRRSEIIKRMQGDTESEQAKAEAALKQRAAEAEVSKVEVEVEERRSQIALNAARAQKEAQEGSGDDIELRKLQAELEMEQQRLDQEMAAKQQELSLKREEMIMKMQLEREKHNQDMELKQQSAQQDAELKRQQAESQAASQRAQSLRAEAETKPPTASE